MKTQKGLARLHLKSRMVVLLVFCTLILALQPSPGGAANEVSGQYARAAWVTDSVAVTVTVEPAGYASWSCGAAGAGSAYRSTVHVLATFADGSTFCQIIQITTQFVESPDLSMASLGVSTNLGFLQVNWKSSALNTNLSVTANDDPTGSPQFAFRNTDAEGSLGSDIVMTTDEELTSSDSGGPTGLGVGLFH
ncbi:MAG: hypothetical protein ACYDAY_07320 [Candidatus Dormibacteria bacterium]